MARRRKICPVFAWKKWHNLTLNLHACVRTCLSITSMWVKIINLSLQTSLHTLQWNTSVNVFYTQLLIRELHLPSFILNHFLKTHFSFLHRFRQSGKWHNETDFNIHCASHKIRWLTSLYRYIFFLKLFLENIKYAHSYWSGVDTWYTMTGVLPGRGEETQR